MSIEENKALVRHFLESVEAHEEKGVEAMLSPHIAKTWHEFLPFYHDNYFGHDEMITDMIAEGDQVVVRLAAKKQAKPDHLVPAKAKQWRDNEVIFFKVHGGKIVEFDALLYSGGEISEAAASENA